MTELISFQQSIKKKVIEPAHLEWVNDEFPKSLLFDETYYSLSGEGGLAESRQIFLNQNRLPARWEKESFFSILETGFGTGLNFLLTYREWKKATAEQLIYFSIEKHPLKKEDLKKALRPFESNFTVEINELMENYPELLPGFHRIDFFGGRVRLVLIFLDVGEALPQIEGQFQCFYLDGFSPRKNPQMWNEKLFSEIKRLSSPGATLSTFSVAGVVKRGLSGVGFSVEKREGFSGKRESLFAKNPGDFKKGAKEKKIAVIGGGIAGTSIAKRLSSRNQNVTLFEQKKISSGGSGNTRGLIKPMLYKEWSDPFRFIASGFERLNQELRVLKADSYEKTGIVHLAFNEKLQERFKGSIDELKLPESFCRYLTQEETEEALSLHVKSGSIFFPTAGLISPIEFCNLNANKLNVVYEKVSSLEQTDSGWKLTFGSEISYFDDVVVATSYEWNCLSQLSALPLRKMRGQVVTFKNEALQPMKVPLAFGDYLLKLPDQSFVLGAANDRHHVDLGFRESEEVDLYDKLNSHLVNSIPFTTGGKGRVGLRATTPDSLPLIGQVPELSQESGQRGIPSYQGLWCFLGLGSRGLISSAIGCDLLESLILDEPISIDKTLKFALSPDRFAVRGLKKNKLLV